MHFLGESVSDDDVRAMIKEADADHDGLVDFEGQSLSKKDYFTLLSVQLSSSQLPSQTLLFERRNIPIHISRSGFLTRRALSFTRSIRLVRSWVEVNLKIHLLLEKYSDEEGFV